MTDLGRRDTYIFDEVPYPSYVHDVADPDHLCAAGQFYGWAAHDPATASVLEIGCFDGLNLMTVAAAFPQSRCVGFDLSADAIERGRHHAAQAGLQNIRLEHGDILTYPRDGQQFDYVLVHGVLSWVPPSVRIALFELIAARLAPGGVAYIGYDALPAAASKAEIVRFLIEHVGSIDDPVTRVETAVGLVRTLAANQSAQSRLAPQLNELVKNVEHYARAYFLHDWLVEAYTPFSVRSFALMASAAGLAFAGDARLNDLNTGDIDAGGQQILRANAGSLVSFATAVDLLRGARMYRTDMVVRQDAPPPRLESRNVRYSFVSEITKISGDGDAAIKVVNRARLEATLSDPRQIALVEWLASRSPDEFGVEEVAAGIGIEAHLVAGLLRFMTTIGMLEIHATPQPFTLAPGEHPRVTRLAHDMAASAPRVASLRHSSEAIPDGLPRRLLVLSDGTRTRDDMVRELANGETSPSRAQVDATIEALARLRLFLA